MNIFIKSRPNLLPSIHFRRTAATKRIRINFLTKIHYEGYHGVNLVLFEFPVLKFLFFVIFLSCFVTESSDERSQHSTYHDIIAYFRPHSFLFFTRAGENCNSIDILFYEFGAFYGNQYLRGT